MLAVKSSVNLRGWSIISHVQKGESDFRYIRSLLGHYSRMLTKIYVRMLQLACQKLANPSDFLDIEGEV